jgi:hypothetical protein
VGECGWSIRDKRIVFVKFFIPDFSMLDNGLSLNFFELGGKKHLDSGGRNAINIAVSG